MLISATNFGGSGWVDEPLHEEGLYSSITLIKDSSDIWQRHISHVDSSTGYLRHTYSHGSSSWSVENIDTTVYTTYTSIAAASDGSLHISYQDEDNYALKYATNEHDGTNWIIETVDDGDAGSNTVGDWGGDRSLAVDSNKVALMFL